jgi:hypothetical protein
MDDAIRVELDRGYVVLGADMAGRVDPHRGDADGAKIVFREEFVARGLPLTQWQAVVDLAPRRQEPRRQRTWKAQNGGAAPGDGWRRQPSTQNQGASQPSPPKGCAASRGPVQTAGFQNPSAR